MAPELVVPTLRRRWRISLPRGFTATSRRELALQAADPPSLGNRLFALFGRDGLGGLSGPDACVAMGDQSRRARPGPPYVRAVTGYGSQGRVSSAWGMSAPRPRFRGSHYRRVGGRSFGNRIRSRRGTERRTSPALRHRAVVDCPKVDTRSEASASSSPASCFGRSIWRCCLDSGLLRLELWGKCLKWG